MQRVIGWVLLTMSTLVVVSSCSKDPLKDLSDEESRIYITNHDSMVDFNAYKTYSIVDSVSLIDNGRFAGREATSWDQQVISSMQNAMNARGYTKVDRSQNPDLGITVSRVYNTNTNVVNLSNYWDYYGGYYDPYYWGYGGYDYYFPSYGVYQSTEAALSIDMLDLRNASGGQTIKGVWNGLIRGQGIFVSSNVQSQIQALFDQSPYLKTNR
jgi:Domain of unknown function (DUF4136)